MAPTLRTIIQTERPRIENSTKYHSLLLHLQVMQWKGYKLQEIDWGWSKSGRLIAPIMTDQVYQ